MKIILTLTLGLFFALESMAQSFLPQTEDLPQMPGLEQIEEVANFDSPSEQLLILTALTTHSIQKVEKYYNDTLKNLGWQKLKKNQYQRQTDSLEIELTPKGNKTLVQFTLTQKNESKN